MAENDPDVVGAYFSELELEEDASGVENPPLNFDFAQIHGWDEQSLALGNLLGQENGEALLLVQNHLLRVNHLYFVGI